MDAENSAPPAEPTPTEEPVGEGEPSADEAVHNDSPGLTSTAKAGLEGAGVIVLKRFGDRAFDVSKAIKAGYKYTVSGASTAGGLPFPVPTNPFGVPFAGSLGNFLALGAIDKRWAARRLVDGEEKDDEILSLHEKTSMSVKLFNFSNRKVVANIMDADGVKTGKFEKSLHVPLCKRTSGRVYDPAGNLLGLIKQPACCDKRRTRDPVKGNILLHILDASETIAYKIILRTGCYCRGDPIVIHCTNGGGKSGSAKLIRTHKFCTGNWLSGGFFSKLQMRFRINFPADASAADRLLIYCAFMFMDIDNGA